MTRAITPARKQKPLTPLTDIQMSALSAADVTLETPTLAGRELHFDPDPDGTERAAANDGGDGEELLNSNPSTVKTKTFVNTNTTADSPFVGDGLFEEITTDVTKFNTVRSLAKPMHTCAQACAHALLEPLLFCCAAPFEIKWRSRLQEG